MQNLTTIGQQIANDIAQRYNLSIESTINMLVAVNNGGGGMAQFSIPELGSGQWMQGGMTMVGDMFNHGLQATVNNLCNELSIALANNQIFPMAEAGTSGSNQWWPAQLGVPFSSGAQNNTRYAIFPQRLAVDVNGSVTVYDTLDHNIGGVSQQQGGDTTLSFSSQYGTLSVTSLPVVLGTASPEPQMSNFAEPASQAPFQTIPDEPFESTQPQQTANTVVDLLEKLGKLRDAGVLSQDEFDSKKQQLLAKI